MNRYYIWHVCVFCCFLLLFTEKAAAAEPPALASPLIRMYEGESAAAGVNQNGTADPEVKQVDHTEMYYMWQPRTSMSVSEIQFYSSAPGKAYIRMYKSENGKPGALLAESAFQSEEEGWQGIPFADAVQVIANQSYIVSYAHEREIYGYMTTAAKRRTVSLYWREIGFQDFTVHIDAPELQAADVKENKVYLQWSAVRGGRSYEVYRDGVQIASTASTQFIDTIGEEEATHVYTVRARHSREFVSDMSNSLQVVIEAESIDENEEEQESSGPDGTDDGTGEEETLPDRTDGGTGEEETPPGGTDDGTGEEETPPGGTDGGTTGEETVEETPPSEPDEADNGSTTEEQEGADEPSSESNKSWIHEQSAFVRTRFDGTA